MASKKKKKTSNNTSKPASSTLKSQSLGSKSVKTDNSDQTLQAKKVSINLFGGVEFNDVGTMLIESSKQSKIVASQEQLPHGLDSIKVSRNLPDTP